MKARSIQGGLRTLVFVFWLAGGEPIAARPGPTQVDSQRDSSRSAWLSSPYLDVFALGGSTFLFFCSTLGFFTALRERRTRLPARGRWLFSRRRYRRRDLEAWVDEVPLGVIYWDSEFRPLRWNRPIADEMGLDAADAGEKALSRLRPDLWSRVRPHLPLEKALWISLASEPDLQWCFFPIRGKNGRVSGYGTALRLGTAAADPSVATDCAAEKARCSLDMNAAIDAALAALAQPLGRTRAVIVRTKMPRVFGDPAQIEQLVRVLIGEALGAFHGDEPPVLTLLAIARTESWEFVIRANRRGLSPQETSALFRPRR
jgi:hypothetical protein